MQERITVMIARENRTHSSRRRMLVPKRVEQTVKNCITHLLISSLQIQKIDERYEKWFHKSSKIVEKTEQSRKNLNASDNEIG